MRKVLLASTALVAMAGVNAATADISFSGNSTFDYNAWSESPDNTTGGNNNTSTLLTTNITIKGSVVSDSGLSASVSQALSNGADDGHSMTLSDDWGSIQFNSSGGMGDDMETSADVALDEATTSGADFDGDSAVATGSNTVSYKTPSVNGFQASAGFGDAGAASKADVTSYGVSYKTEAAGASITLKYAQSNTSAAAGSGDDTKASSMGAVVAFGDVTVTLASNTKDAGTASDYEGTGFGIAYAASDNLALAAHSKSAENDGAASYDYSEAAVSANYTIASGITAGVTYTDWDLTDAGGDKSDGTYTRVTVKVSF
ncbi:MAG: porin [Candidatus Puniceispirillaceae bacterium]